MRDDGIWRGDQCIAPDDPRNFGPEWERITAWYQNDQSRLKIKKSPGAHRPLPPGIISRETAMEHYGVTSREVFTEIMRRAGVQPVEVRGRYSFWRDAEVALATRLHSCNGVLQPSLERAAQYFNIPKDELERCIHFCGIQRCSHSHYDIADLRYAVSQSTWIKNHG